MANEEQIWIKLAQMPNLLSKRLSPQRSEIKLTRAPERGVPSVRDIIAGLRDHEAHVYPKMHMIATQDYPDLRFVSDLIGSVEYSHDDLTLTVLAQFRRIRMTTMAFLRELPADAWERLGKDELGRRVSIHDLALQLIQHDAEQLALLDATLIARDAMPFNVTPVVVG